MLALSIDGFRPRPTVPRPAFPVTSNAVPSSPNLCARSLPRPGRGVGVYPERLGAFRSPDPCLSSFKLLALSGVEGSTSNRLFRSRPKSFTIRTSAKHTHNPCRMRSFKTQDLKPFRMCSSKKNGVGDGTLSSYSSLRSLRVLCVSALSFSFFTYCQL